MGGKDGQKTPENYAVTEAKREREREREREGQAETETIQ